MSASQARALTMETDFRQKVDKAIARARTVLALGTNPELPEVRESQTKKKKTLFLFL
jgi:hypothetical protein